ncbi:MAG: DUF5666 domain-containing protein [Polaromonas sp.]|nr:DUF5666 domain-containing protein [Polaromonas sp.]
MKQLPTTFFPQRLNRRNALVLTVGATALSLAGCGGGADGAGGSLAGVSSGGTGSFSTGAITGFGSIIVAGVRFDDSKASSIRDIDSGTDLRGQLKLGMVVRIKGQPKSMDGFRADADSIEVRSELLGPVESINAAAATLVVLGQTVKISPTTTLEDGLAGLAAVSIGNILELHGFNDPASNSLSATRVEKKRIADVKAFKLQGAIRNLNTQARTFSIGALSIGYATADLTGLALRDALVVRVQLSPAASGQSGGARTATSIRASELESRDVAEAKIEGTVTAITSLTQFSVGGVPVNASEMQAPANLALGVRVEVEGRLVNGVLIARKIELEDEFDLYKFELRGTISGLNTTAKTFVLRGVTVDYNRPVEFKDGLALDLSNLAGRAIKVKGTLAVGGTRVQATEISIDN